MFADSSFAAYSLALITGPSDVILWCDVQLTKDAAGICFPDLKLDNNSDIASVYKDKQKAYLVNGVSTKGWFSVDYTFKDLGNVICKFSSEFILFVFFPVIINVLSIIHFCCECQVKISF